jgi:hypothetical protein
MAIAISGFKDEICLSLKMPLIAIVFFATKIVNSTETL